MDLGVWKGKCLGNIPVLGRMLWGTPVLQRICILLQSVFVSNCYDNWTSHSYSLCPFSPPSPDPGGLCAMCKAKQELSPIISFQGWSSWTRGCLVVNGACSVHGSVVCVMERWGECFVGLALQMVGWIMLYLGFPWGYSTGTSRVQY